MFIKDIHINGFGIFHNFPLRDLSSGLTIIEGLNEAGKTTILAFIRAVLFGFEDGRSKRNLYPPLIGGEHGGILTIRTESNEDYVITRLAGKRGGTVTVTLPDGTLGCQEDLNSLLAGTSKDVFRTIFAFGLGELREIETLTKGEVQDKIYSAGIGLTGKSLPDLLAGLNQEIGKIFKGRGKQIINKLLAERDELQQRLQVLIGHSDAYAHLRKNHKELTAAIQNEEEAKQADVKRLQRVESLLGAWGDWVDLRNAEEKLEALPVIDSFPPDGGERLDGLSRGRDKAQEELDKINARIRRLEEEQKGLEIDKLILALRSTIERMQRGRDRFDDAENDLPKRQEELTSAEAGFQASLRQLGPNWDEDKVRSFDSSIPTREDVRRYRESLVSADEKLRDAQRERQHLEEQKTRPLWPVAGLALLGLGAGLILSWLSNTTNGLWLAAFFAVLASGGYFLYWRQQKVSLRERLQTAISLEGGRQEEFEVRKQEWSTYLIEKGTDPNLSPESALEVFTTIEGTRIQLRTVEDLRSRVHIIQESIETYKKDAITLLEETGRALSPDQLVTLAIDNLAKDLQAYIINHTRYEDLQRAISEAKSEREALKAVLSRIKADIASLFAEGGVETDEKFRDLGTVFAERQELDATCRERKKNLQLLAGLDEAYETFREELAASSPELLQGERESLKAQVKPREQRLDDQKNERGALENQINELEQAEETSELRLRINSLDAELAIYAEQWSILQISQALLVETRDQYEKEHKPGVIQQAEPIFANLTDERYQRILSPPGERKIDVLDTDGRRKEIQHLSGGTLEQLLLAIRLGFIQEYSRRVKPFPLIMDDILVNFDPIRRLAAASVLAQLAETHQILYFTCHPEIVAILTEAAPTAATIPLTT